MKVAIATRPAGMSVLPAVSHFGRGACKSISGTVACLNALIGDISKPFDSARFQFCCSLRQLIVGNAGQAGQLQAVPSLTSQASSDSVDFATHLNASGNQHRTIFASGTGNGCAKTATLQKQAQEQQLGLPFTRPSSGIGMRLQPRISSMLSLHRPYHSDAAAAEQQPSVPPGQPSSTHSIQQCKKLKELQILVEEEGHGFNHVQVVACFSQFGKVPVDFCNRHVAVRLMQQLGDLVQQPHLANRLRARELGNILHAVAKLHRQDGGLLRAVAVCAQGDALAKAEQPGGEGSSATQHQQSTSAPVPAFIQFVMDLACEQIMYANKPQHISNILWALSVLRHRHTRLIAACIESAKAREFSGWPGQSFSASLLAVARLGHRDASFVDAAAEAALKTGLKGFSSQSLSNILWALAELDHPHAGLVDGCLQAALALGPATFAPQGLANTLWALAKLRHSAPEVVKQFTAAADTALRTQPLRQFAPQGISNILWALSTLGTYDRAFVETAMWAAKQKGLTSFSPQALCNIASSLRVLRVFDQPFASALQQAAVQLGLASWSQQGLMSFLWTLASWQSADHKFLAAWEAEVRRRPSEELSPAFVTHGLWALAVLGELRVDGASRRLLDRLFQLYSADPGSISPEQYTFVFNALDGQPEVQRAAGLPAGLLERCTAEMRARVEALSREHTKHAGLGSGFHKSVLEALPAEYRAAAQVEHLTEDGCMTVDVALPWEGGVRLAIEADGRTHYYRNPPFRVAGHTELRNRALRRRGYVPVSVEMHSWNIESDAVVHRHLLLSKIRKAVEESEAMASA